MAVRHTSPTDYRTFGREVRARSALRGSACAPDHVGGATMPHGSTEVSLVDGVRTPQGEHGAVGEEDS